MSDAAPERSVHLRWGGATDVGQVRSVNQDSMLLGPDLFVVADGMGGHQGGEVASALAIEAVTERAPGRSVDELVEAVAHANETVFVRSGQDPNLAGMGTTFVGIAVVVEDGEERLAIVNVGDSRAYRLSGGQLDQITQDHSLVGELVREGRITPEEAEVHPQRNIVTRALGIDHSIPVDDFQILPQAGDRYLLCSDGLTNEVTERDIAIVLRTIDDPDEAARELVRRANEHGGRDNITIVIVDVVADGGLAGRASALVPDDDNFSSHPDEDTQQFLAIPDDQAHVGPDHMAARIAEDDADDVDPAASDEPDPVLAGKRQRAITWRSIAFVLVVAGLVFGGAFLVNDFVRNTYTVGVESEEITIFRGRPGGFLWFEPAVVERTGILTGEVPEAFLDDLIAGVSRPTLESARTYVENLQDRIDAITPPVTTTTTTTTRPTSTTTRPGGATSTTVRPTTTIAN